MDDLSNHEATARFHLEAARALLPVPLREPCADSVELLETWLKAKPFSVRGGPGVAEFGAMDVLRFAYNQLEKLGEMNECSPQFWQHLTAAAEQMHEALTTNVNRSLVEADRQLRRLETNFEGQDIVSHAQESNTDLSAMQAHYFHMAAHAVASSAVGAQQALRHNRLTPAQREQYFSLLKRFKVFLPELEKRNLAAKDVAMQKIIAAMKALEP